MNVIRAFLTFLPVWISYLAIRLIFIILGHIVLPPLLAYGLYIQRKTGYWPWIKYSPNFDKYYAGLPDWAYIWSNEGDSVLGPPEYKARYPKWSNFRRAWTWSAVRNPANNLRFIPFFGLRIDPDKVRYVTNRPDLTPKDYYTAQPFAIVTWQAGTPFAGFLAYYKNNRGTLIKVMLGFKIYPFDLYDIPHMRIRHKNAGFGTQWKRVPPGELTRIIL